MKFYQRSWFIILMIIFVFPVGIYLLYKYSKWHIAVKVIITAVGVGIIYAVIIAIVSVMMPNVLAIVSTQDTANKNSEQADMAIEQEKEGVEGDYEEEIQKIIDNYFEKEKKESQAKKLSAYPEEQVCEILLQNLHEEVKNVRIDADKARDMTEPADNYVELYKKAFPEGRNTILSAIHNSSTEISIISEQNKELDTYFVDGIEESYNSLEILTLYLYGKLDYGTGISSTIAKYMDSIDGTCWLAYNVEYNEFLGYTCGDVPYIIVTNKKFSEEGVFDFELIDTHEKKTLTDGRGFEHEAKVYELSNVDEVTRYYNTYTSNQISIETNMLEIYELSKPKQEELVKEAVNSNESSSVSVEMTQEIPDLSKLCMIHIPASWEGLYNQSSYTPSSILFTEKISEQDGYGGTLFSISLEADTEYEYAASYELLGKVTYQSKSYDLVAYMPTDIQFNNQSPAAMTNYMTMSADIPEILMSISFNSGAVFEPGVSAFNDIGIIGSWTNINVDASVTITEQSGTYWIEGAAAAGTNCGQMAGELVYIDESTYGYSAWGDNTMNAYIIYDEYGLHIKDDGTLGGMGVSFTGDYVKE